MPAISDKAAFDTIGLIYDYALGSDTNKWDQIFNRISQTINSGPGGMSLHSASDDSMRIVASSMDPDHVKSYLEYYQHISPIRQSITSLPPGQVFRTNNTANASEYENTEYYSDFQKKAGVFETEYHSLSSSNGITGGIGFSRPKRNPQFNSSERQFLLTVLPHLRRAFLSYSKIREYTISNQILTEALSLLGHGVIVIDKTGRIVFSNVHADKLMSAEDGIRLRKGILSAKDSREDSRLRVAINSFFEMRSTSPGEKHPTLRISRTNDKRPLELSLTAVSPESLDLYENERLALVTIHDVDRIVIADGALLGKFQGLTNAEARIASMLANGNSVKEICEFLNVSNNTVRTHIKRIFSKTSTNRQSELVKLILSSSSITNLS